MKDATNDETEVNSWNRFGNRSIVHLAEVAAFPRTTDADS